MTDSTDQAVRQTARGAKRGIRRRWTHILHILLLALLSAVLVLPAPAEAQLFGPAAPLGIDGPAPEVRALWVDSYRDGFKTPQQADRLLADARRANINTLLVQVRRRGEALYDKRIEPRTDDPDLATGFDPLAYLIEHAHNDSPRIEVHAWVNTMSIWGSPDRAPADPNHVFNQHGINATGRDDWLTRREDGETYSVGYFLDAGHPDAAKYTVDVLLDLVRQYDVDGVHLDYIRYPERKDGFSWGYNATSIARFNAHNSRSGRPAANDPQWAQWRRDQVTALVRATYLGILGIKPRVKLSAAVIPWGDGPRTDADWKTTSAYTSVYQDWRAWLEEGIVDMVMPMNYFRESRPDNVTWFNHWLAWQRDHAYGRQVIPAVAIYLNSPSESIAQIKRVLALGPGGNRVAGVALYSYGVTQRGGNENDSTTPSQKAEVWAALTDPGAVNGNQPPFAGRTVPPALAWKAAPDNGNVLLRAPGLDGARVDLSGPKAVAGETDGNGLFGILSLPPGRYDVTVSPGSAQPRAAEIVVAPGTLATLDLP
ncbi:MAG: family 10 glycosylhydrolase [Chloroflexi bacterium]|nr:family 10 glycosylhydrolase [Chloroflexota bacterium]